MRRSNQSQGVVTMRCLGLSAHRPTCTHFPRQLGSASAGKEFRTDSFLGGEEERVKGRIGKRDRQRQSERKGRGVSQTDTGR